MLQKLTILSGKFSKIAKICKGRSSKSNDTLWKHCPNTKCTLIICASIQPDWVEPINHNLFLYCCVTVGWPLDNRHIHLVDYTSSNCQPPFWHLLLIFFPLLPFLHLCFFQILCVLVSQALLQGWCSWLLKRINVFPLHHMKIYGTKYVSVHIKSAAIFFLKELANCSAGPGRFSLCLQAVNDYHSKEYGLYVIHQCRTGDMSHTMDVPLPPAVLFTTVILWDISFDAMPVLWHNSQYPTASSFQRKSLQSISWPGKNNLNALSDAFLSAYEFFALYSCFAIVSPFRQSFQRLTYHVVLWPLFSPCYRISSFLFLHNQKFFKERKKIVIVNIRS